MIAEHFGVEDAWPVVCEPFTQWVLEDQFPPGRPPFEEVGVQVVPDVEPYELMKLRLLNASHQALCYFGYLRGYRLAHEVAQDPLFADFLLGYMDEEATPTLAPVPGVDLDAYKRQLDRAVRQPRDPGHRRPAVRGELGPHPQVAAAGHPAPARDRRRDPPVGARGRQLGPLRRGRRRAGRADRRRRPAPRRGDGPGRAAARATRWRSSATADLFGDLVEDERFTTEYLAALDVAARARRPRHAGGVGDGVTATAHHARRGAAREQHRGARHPRRPRARARAGAPGDEGVLDLRQRHPGDLPRAPRSRARGLPGRGRRPRALRRGRRGRPGLPPAHPRRPGRGLPHRRLRDVRASAVAAT